MRYIIETTKTDAGTRKIPITEDVVQTFQAIIEDRIPPKVKKVIDGYSGFLFYDENDMPLVAMGHTDISVTMNVYTHIGFVDAEEELKRMKEFRKAQADIEKKSDAKAVSQKMFKVV